MTVKELINELGKYPEDLEVVVNSNTETYGPVYLWLNRVYYNDNTNELELD